LQALLEERFHLKIHSVERDLPVYALVVAKGGPKLEPAKEGSCTPVDFSAEPPPNPCGAFFPDGRGGTKTLHQTMAGLCLQFSAVLDRDVVDRTGLSGGFDIDMPLAGEDLFPFAGKSAPPPGEAPPPADPLSAIMAAVQKLGLRIEPAKASTQFLAIDHLERPSEN